MIAHTGVGVRDFQAAKRFYEQALAPLGYAAKLSAGDAVGFNDGKNTDFWIGESKTVEPTHVAFEAKNKDEVEAFYHAALAAGGRDNGEPGCAFRPMTDTIPNRWRTPFRRHGGQCSDGMADTLAAGSEGCPP